MVQSHSKNFSIFNWKTISLVGFFLGLYYHIIIKLIYDWGSSPDNSHGFLVPFIAAYLFWEKKDQIIKIEIKTENWGLLVLVLGLLLNVLGVVGAEFFTMRFSMIVVIFGIIYFLCGKEMVKNLLLPVGYLVFMIPIPAIVFNVIAFPLKLFAANIATEIIQFINIPVYREGNIIQLVGITLEVADACSGIRSLMPMIALGVAYAYFSQNSLIKKIILVLLTIPITILANVMRVTGTGILTHYVGPAAALGFFHEFAGIFIFLVAFAMLVLTGTIINKMVNGGKDSGGTVK